MSFNGSGSFLINTAGQPVVSGTVISSTAFNALTADLATGLSTCITKDGQTTVTANIPMANYKFTGLGAGSGAADSANLSQVQSTVVKLLASVSGTDTITAVGSPTVSAYAAGQMFYFVAAGDNTGAVTINIDSLGAKAVTRDGSVALVAGDIKSGEVVVIVYDGTRFQVVSQLNSSGDARFANVSIASALNVGGVATVTGGSVLNGGVVINEPGADADTRIEGDTDANLFFADASTDRIGIGTSSPQDKLSVLTSQGLNTFANPIMSYGASTNWAAGFANIYDASYVDQFMLLNARMTGGTRAAPTFNANSPANGGIALKVDGLDGGLAIQTIPNGTGQSATTRLYLNPSGNLGLGVTPSAWGSIFKAVQVGTGGSIFGRASANQDVCQVGANVFWDGSNWKYIASLAATRYEQASGTHVWSYAASGTAGSTISFTEAMTLDASGRLGIGTTSPATRLDVRNTASTTGSIVNIANSSSAAAGNIVPIRFFTGNTFGGLEQCAAIWGINPNAGTNNGGALVFATSDNGTATTPTERARITAGGYGKFSNNGSYQNATGAYHEFNQNAANEYTSWFRHTSNTAPYGIYLYYNSAAPNGTANDFLYCLDNAAQRASIRSNGGLANYQANNVDLSDARTKKDITPAASMWDKIGALEIVTYKYNDQTHDDVNVGVIAQQVEAVEPVWVDSDGFGETPEGEEPLKTVYTKDIYFAAIKALQEAMARIEQLEAKVAALEAK